MKKVLLTLAVFGLAMTSLAQSQFPPLDPVPKALSQVKVGKIFWLSTNDTLGISPTAYPGAMVFRQQPGDTSVYYSDGVSFVRIGSKTILDSARRSNDTLYFRTVAGSEIAVKMEGILIPGVVGLQDSLDVRLTFSSRMTPLMTGANLPIQPSDSLTQALAKLQAQINSFDGAYFKLTTATPQTAAAGYIQGHLNIKGNSGSNFGMMMERASKANDDIALGWKSETDTVGYIGLVNKGLNHITLYNLKDNLRFGIRDTARMEFITLNPDNTGRIGTTFWNGRWNIGDSLPANDVFGRYPIDVISTQDTSIRTLNKIVSDASIHASGGFQGITESLSDSTQRSASTQWVKQWVRTQSYYQTLQTVLNQGATATTPMAINAATGSAYAGIFTNTGTGAFHGLYVNISSASTGNALRVDKNSVQKLLVDADGETTVVSLATAVTTITGNTTLDATHGSVRANNTGSITITLPAASGCAGRIYKIKKISAASNDVVIDPNGAETIDGMASKTLTLQYSSLIIQSNGTGWDIVGGHVVATTY